MASSVCSVRVVVSDIAVSVLFIAHFYFCMAIIKNKSHAKN